ncbi:hypothetical protein L218DRAFT_969838 [Marasmius fiardii PR-910]|nr:hypothetical protein L218DRAFT_969838 [Marasmius fiardii PR-910]
MQWSAMVLSTVSSDTEPSILVTFDAYKYLFNVGENTSRAFLQSQRNWKRTKGLFLTAATTERAGGLAGLLMTFADATIPRLDVIGPPGLKHYMASMRYYTYRDSMPVIPTETSQALPDPSSNPNPVYKDEFISVFSIPVYPSEPQSEMEAQNTTETGKRKHSGESEDQPSSKRLHADSGIPSSNSSALDEENVLRGAMINAMFPASERATSRNTKKGKKQKKQSVKETKGPETGDAASGGNVDEYRRARLPRGFHSQLPKFEPQQPTNVAYVVVGPRVRGKFDAGKAGELRIPKGKLRYRLAQGETITFTVDVDGAGPDEKRKEMRTVKPEEIIAPSDPPGVILILDVPTPAHIPSATQPFVDSRFFKRFRSNADGDLADYAVRSVFHICGEGVLEDERYKSFMRGFWKGTHHVVASREYCPDPVTFTSAAHNQLRLSQLDSEIFPVPKFCLTPKKNISNVPGLPSNVQLMSANQIVGVRPPLAPVVNKEALELDWFHPIINSLTGISLTEETQARFEEAKKRVEVAQRLNQNSDGTQTVTPGSDVRIITLGTGSACPSKYRNVSATLIMIPNYGNILLDCGEGTWGQLARHFGTDETHETNVWKVLKDLRCIYISHAHGDHHMGVANILKKRKQIVSEPSDPLYLVTIRPVHLYLRELSDLQDLGIFDDPSKNGVVTVVSPALHWRQIPSYPTSGIWQVGGDEPWLDIELNREHARAMCEKLGLKAFSTVDVRHRTRCYGVVIRHIDGWSIVYSGDTQPSDSLVYASESSPPTVLIHEATMADDQEELAAKKAHSTVGQALEIGKRMKAENILLTHFSNRYPKIPIYKLDEPRPTLTEGSGVDGQQQEVESGFDPSKGVVAVAFDHADMKIADMWKINYFLPALESSYAETVVEEGEDGVGGDSGAMEIDVSG